MYQATQTAGFGQGWSKYLFNVFAANTQTLGYVSATTVTFSLSHVKMGDIVYFIEHASNGVTTTLPTSATPSGWETMVDVPRVNSGDYVRTLIHQKYIDHPNDIGGTVSGMTTGSTARTGVLITFRSAHRPIQYSGLYTSSGNTHVNAVSNITLPVSARQGPAISLGFYAARSAETATCTMSPTQSGTLTVSGFNTNRCLYQYINMGGSFADVTISMTDSGTSNHMVGALFELR